MSIIPFPALYCNPHLWVLLFFARWQIVPHRRQRQRYTALLSDTNFFWKWSQWTATSCSFYGIMYSNIKRRLFYEKSCHTPFLLTGHIG